MIGLTPNHPDSFNDINNINDWQNAIDGAEKNLSNKELLDVILNSLSKGKGAAAKGNKLLKSFFTLYGLGNASVEELKTIGKLTEEQVILLKSALELGKRWVHESEEPLIEVNSSYEVFKFIYPQMRGLKKELFKILLLNPLNQIIKNLDAFKGTVTGVSIYVREVMEIGMKHHATSFIFVHNHPSGSSQPGKRDMILTKNLVLAGEILRIPVADHIVIGDNEYYSFLDEGLIDRYKSIQPDFYEEYPD